MNPLKNKRLFLSIAILLTLGALSLLLQFLFKKADENFSFAGICFLLTAFFLWQYKNALVPLKTGGPVNTSKSFWHSIKKPKGYRYACLIWGAIMLLIAIGNLIAGFVMLI